MGLRPRTPFPARTHLGIPVFQQSEQRPVPVACRSVAWKLRSRYVRGPVYRSSHVQRGLVALAVFLSYALFRAVGRRSTVKNLRGPESHSFWLGNEVEFRYQNEVGDYEFQWMRDYGSAWRTVGCMGEDSLTLVDPKAIQYILQTSGYRWPKQTVWKETARIIMGQGLLWAHGETHSRQRKIMNPAFTTPQLKSFLSLFQQHGMKLVQKWKDEIASSNSPNEGVMINTATWFSRVTLDIIGLAGFNYDFSALEDGKNEIAAVYKNLFLDSTLYPSKIDILFRAFWRYIPEEPLHLIRYLPTKEYKRFLHYTNVMRSLAPRIINRNEASGNGKDIVSVLARANETSNPKARLSDTEVHDQMSTLLLAGHDTTANALMWFFYEISQSLEWQRKIREELAAARTRVVERGDDDFSIADLEGMSIMNACLKESMRLHPIVFRLLREAGQDDVLPLAFPVTTKTGEQISQIPVRKGQPVTISIAGYNRLEAVWGADPHKFHPERFLEMDKTKQASVGVYANLLNFSAGLRACIGWRFSVIELQALVATFLENFEFTFAEGAERKKVVRKPAALMLPVVEGHHGSWMGLRVRAVQ